MYNFMIVKGKILQWGNSWGIRLNKSKAVAAGLHANEDVEIKVTRKITLGKDIFGILPRKIDTAKALREIDELFGEK